MDRRVSFHMYVSTDIPEEERESLLMLLRPLAEVVELEQRPLILDWQIVLVILAQLVSIAANSLKIAKILNDWRHEARLNNIDPKVKFEHPQKATLNLEEATDEEVVEWLEDL